MNFVIFSIIIALLLFLAAFFSCTETAITSITKAEKRSLIGKKNQATLKLLTIKDKIVFTTLVGTNVVNNLTTSVVTAFALTKLSYFKNATTISTVVISFLIIFFAEILPKSLATYKGLSIIKVSTPVLNVARFVFLPITFVLNVLSNIVLKVLSRFGKNADFFLTDNHLQSLVDISLEDKALNTDEQVLLQGAIRLRDLKLRNIVTPLIEESCVPSTATVAEALEVFCSTKFSRLPVYTNNDTNEIVGILHYKDILFNEETSIASILREVVFLPESASVFKVIDIMKTKSTNMIIAIDEYGQNVGIATMDDIITAVFGTVQDEYDEEEQKDIIRLSDTRFKISGEAKLHDVNRTLSLSGSDFELKSEYYDSIAGFILENFQELPTEGEVINIGNIDFKIEKIVDRKIETIVLNIKRLSSVKFKPSST